MIEDAIDAISRALGDRDDFIDDLIATGSAKERAIGEQLARDRDELRKLQLGGYTGKSRSDDAVSNVVSRIDIAETVMQTPPPVRWVIPGYIEIGEIINLQGYGKAGKSLTATAAGIAAASGKPFLDMDIEPLDWLVYVDAENPSKTIKRRLHRLGVPARIAGAFHLYSARGLNLGSPAGRMELDDLIPNDGSGADHP
jgi:hypothetical protein